MAQLSDLIQKLNRLSSREWAESARVGSLSLSEFEYLNAVDEQAHRPFGANGEHGQHLHDIVAELGVTKASASSMISKLQGRGLVERFQCQMDARAYHITLTPKGAVLLAQGKQVYARIADIAEKELGEIAFTPVPE